MKFYKYHALGNDYIVINPNESPLPLTPERIKLICHRNYGVGSDGILLGPIYSGGSISLKIFNPDGSEAEKSGNGIRIFSRYLIGKNLVSQDTFEIATLGGTVTVEKLKEDGSLLRVAMGKVTFESDMIPVLGKSRKVIDEKMTFGQGTYKITCVSIGNPHCVIPMQEISPELARAIGPLVENAPIFPNRINVQLMKVIDRNNIQIEIWERGAGYTLASGSSSSAAASAAYKLGLVENNVHVHMPGGQIDIFISSDKSVFMTGGVESVYEGAFTDEFLNKLEYLK